VIDAAIAHKGEGGVFNVSDDAPSPPQDVITFAAMLMGIEPPPEQDVESADLSPMARSFYAENKRASNRKLKDALVSGSPTPPIAWASKRFGRRGKGGNAWALVAS